MRKQLIGLGLAGALSLGLGWATTARADDNSPSEAAKSANDQAQRAAGSADEAAKNASDQAQRASDKADEAATKADDATRNAGAPTDKAAPDTSDTAKGAGDKAKGTMNPSE